MYWDCAMPCIWNVFPDPHFHHFVPATLKQIIWSGLWSISGGPVSHTVCEDALNEYRYFHNVFFKTVFICSTANHIGGSVNKRNQRPLSTVFIILNALINFVLNPCKRFREENKCQINVLLYLYIWNVCGLIWYLGFNAHHHHHHLPIYLYILP